MDSSLHILASNLQYNLKSLRDTYVVNMHTKYFQKKLLKCMHSSQTSNLKYLNDLHLKKYPKALDHIMD